MLGSSLVLILLSLRIGAALTDSLDELITNGSITPQLAMKVLLQVRSVLPASKSACLIGCTNFMLFR